MKSPAGETNPVSARLTSTKRATTSIRTHSVIKSRIAPARMMSTDAISFIFYTVILILRVFMRSTKKLV